MTLPSFLSLLLAEWRKQRRAKLPYFGLIAIIIMSAMWPGLMSNYTDMPAESQTGFQFVAAAMISLATMLVPLFVAIFSATLVASETSRGTIRYVLCRPVTRLSYLTSKFLFAFLYATLTIVMAAVTVAIVGAIAIGYDTQRDWMMTSGLTAGLFWKEFGFGCLLALAPVLATAGFGLCLSVLLKNSGAAVGVTVGAFVSMETITHVMVWGDFRLRDWLWTDYFDTALHLVSRLAEGTPDLWNTREVWMSLAVPGVWILVFGAVSTVAMLCRDWGSN